MSNSCLKFYRSKAVLLTIPPNPLLLIAFVISADDLSSLPVVQAENLGAILDSFLSFGSIFKIYTVSDYFSQYLLFLS